jgi:hypothetical protein
LCRPLDGAANARVRAAAAEIALHRSIDLRVRWVRRGRQKHSSAHDLPRLAIAALWHIFSDPRLLYRVSAGRGQALNGDYALSRHGTERSLAGSDRLVFHVNRACTTQAHAATVLRPGQHQDIAQDPQKRHARVARDGALIAIHSDWKLRHRKLIVMLQATSSNRYLAKGWQAQANGALK